MITGDVYFDTVIIIIAVFGIGMSVLITYVEHVRDKDKNDK